MIEEQKIKELISAYIDGETSQEESKLVEEHIHKNEELMKYFQELKSVSSLLDGWEDEDLSADLEQKVQLSLKEDKMESISVNSRRNLLRVGIGGGALVTILMLVFVNQIYKPVVTQEQLTREVKGVDKGLMKSAEVSDASQKPLAEKSFSTRKASAPESIYFKGTGSKGSKQKKTNAANLIISNVPSVGEDVGRTRSITNFDELAGDSKKDKLGLRQRSFSRVYDSGHPVDEKSNKAGIDIAQSAQFRSQFEQTFTEEGFKVQPQSELDNWDDAKRYNWNFHTEQYDRIYENEFLEVSENPLSTFSIDVDTASYSNMRRILNMNQLPPQDAIRIEEMINYFTYDYPNPKGKHPFSITTNAAICPWNTDHQLVRIGLQGKVLEEKEIPPSNLVFLLDVSGSMNQPNKLPLLKSAFKMMTNQLSANQKVAIVVYAGAAGLVLDSTSGEDKQAILDAIDRLHAGGSTAGGAGIKLAYKIAKENFIKGGNNRVILATDGDFNVGASSNAEMVRLIEEKRKEGVFLTVLGFGMGNYKDSRLEQIANKGNGNYYYIDTDKEARKVMVSELGSTLFTIAKDVKLQLEFNPAQVKAYRLIGYENRMLAKEDFNDDAKDAGELGAGHSVTALYEIVPADSDEEFRDVDELVYQKTQTVKSNDLLTVKFRYKEPDEDKSKLITQKLTVDEIVETPKGDFQFATAVAELGLLLRNSQFKANANYEHVLKSAKESKGADKFGYRQEFIDLTTKAQTLDTRSSGGINFKGEQK